MIAVIETGGKQYTVSLGQTISIETIPEKNEGTVVFSRVLLTHEGEKTEIGTPFLQTTVEGQIVQTGRGEKLRVYKMHAKKRYQKTQGHRQNYVKVEITKIGAKEMQKSTKTVKAPAKTAPQEMPKTSKVTDAPIKKPAAKKTAAPKTPAKKAVVKKPTAKKT